MLNLLIRYYLPVSYRAIVYISTAFFSNILNSSLDLAFPKFGSILFFILSSVSYEVIRSLVKKNYHPKFFQEGSFEDSIKGSSLLVLDKNSYEYRTKQELYLNSTIIHFLLNWVAASIICLVVGDFSFNYIYAIAGAAAFLFSFVGFLFLLINTVGPLAARLIGFSIALSFHLVGWIYVYTGLRILGINFNNLSSLILHSF